MEFRPPTFFFFFLSLSLSLSLNLCSPNKHTKKTVRDPRRDEDRRLLLPGDLPQRQRQRREALLEERQGEEKMWSFSCFG